MNPSPSTPARRLGICDTGRTRNQSGENPSALNARAEAWYLRPWLPGRQGCRLRALNARAEAWCLRQSAGSERPRRGLVPATGGRNHPTPVQRLRVCNSRRVEFNACAGASCLRPVRARAPLLSPPASFNARAGASCLRLSALSSPPPTPAQWLRFCADDDFSNACAEASYLWPDVDGSQRPRRGLVSATSFERPHARHDRCSCSTRD